MAYLQMRRSQLKPNTIKKPSRISQGSLQNKIKNYFNSLNNDKENFDEEFFFKNQDHKKNVSPLSLQKKTPLIENYNSRSIQRFSNLQSQNKNKLSEKNTFVPKQLEKRNFQSRLIEDVQRYTEEKYDIPYFVECLHKRNKLANQAHMHIHLSIITFKTLKRACMLAKFKGVDPKIPPPTPGRKTIIFDMDETLIHTNEIITQGYQIKVPFRCVNGRILHGYVCVRPYAKEILKRLSEHFDIIVFTAGSQPYADPILDHIDPQRVIQHRLYRQSCTLVDNQVFVKDLRIIGRQLESVVLVDNAPHTYMLQMTNGIPIIPYYKGKEDRQLYSLEKYLMSLKEVQDVRKINGQTFQLQDYIKFDSREKLVASLYSRLL